jgi:hypothetical protein
LLTLRACLTLLLPPPPSTWATPPRWSASRRWRGLC